MSSIYQFYQAGVLSTILTIRHGNTVLKILHEDLVALRQSTIIDGREFSKGFL